MLKQEMPPEAAAKEIIDSNMRYSPQYCVMDNWLCEVRERKDTVYERPLCNFAPWISSQETVYDGEKEYNRLHLTGIDEFGRPLREIEIEAKDFQSMNWLLEKWGADCNIAVGSGVKEHIRYAIQSTMRYAERTHLYTVTGWLKRDGRYEYLMPDAENLNVILPGKLQSYSLPPTEEADYAPILVMLDGAPAKEEIMLPLLAFVFLSPLNHFLREVDAEPKSVLFLCGRTGTKKSTLAALMLSFFGRFSASNLPLSFRDTANSIVANLFSLKDVLTCIDDFHPSGRYEESRMNTTAQTVIARILEESGIKNCTAYWQERGIGRGGKKVQPNPYKWKCSTVGKILSQQEYCGDIVNFKTYSKSFKDKARLENPEENWVIFKDVHEPIIERAVFEKVQAIKANTKRRAPKPENAQKNMFCDLLYCADCGKKLWFHVNTINKGIHFFSCSNYVKDYRGTCPTRHYIRADAIEQVVMLELRKLGQFLKEDEEAFAELLARKTNADVIREQAYMTEELKRLEARNAKVGTLYEQLYEKNVEGQVTDEWFMELSHKYEVERMDIKSQMATLKEKLVNLGQMQQNKDLFIAAIRKFMEMDSLTAPLLRELIDRIEVHETEGVGKSRTQRITIYYRFVGYIDIPERRKASNFKADLRKGVAVEYIPFFAEA